MSEQVTYELVAYNRDGEVIAQSTSNIDFNDVVSDADNLQEEVDGYLGYDREPDYDSMAKHERIMEAEEVGQCS